MDLKDYRESPREQARIDSLLGLISDGDTALDIGTRDGYFAKKMAERYTLVTALDLELPDIVHPKINPVKGNVGALQFDDNVFDTVLCAEVLEHLPGELLQRACAELSRVTKRNLVIGVPYRQDTRVGRSTCLSCGTYNPPWGHVNSFDEKRLQSLFPDLHWEKSHFVGLNKEVTNWFSAALMNMAGNPYGTYSQEEGCVACGAKLLLPPARSLPQKICTRVAELVNKGQRRLTPPRPNWIHVLLIKKA
jgi:Methyltransferase domain